MAYTVPKTIKVKVVTGSIAALLFFTSLFSDPFINFWYQMALTVIILCGMAYGFEKQNLIFMLKTDFKKLSIKDVALGLLSAVLLYAVFYVGNIAASWVKGGTDNIAQVYTLKHDNPIWMMALIIGLIVGPGEELFWRGFIQKTLAKETGIGSVLISSLLYCVVHVASCNIMLLAAAFVCGIFWGLMYWKFKNIYINIISHVVWDLLVFLILPFN
jgi:membrane protease YdiL (CAAX protease family)